MRRFLIALCLVIVSLVGMGSTLQAEPAASDAESIFQEAVMKETGERELAQAIELYRKVTLSRKENPALAAKAQLRMGFIYERMNQPEAAIKAYQDVFTLSQTVPTEIAQSAQSNLDRLQTRLERERPVSTQSLALSTSTETSYKKGWLISTSYGVTHIQANNTPGFTQDQFVFWTSLGRDFSPHGVWGFETGYFASKKAPRTVAYSYTYSDLAIPGDFSTLYSVNTEGGNETDNKSVYFGPFIQGVLPFKRAALNASVGLGAHVSWTEETPYYSYSYSGFFTDHGFTRSEPDTITRVRPALPLTLSAEWRITSHWRIGAGVRDLVLLSVDEVGPYQGYGALLVRHVIVPFGKVDFRF